MRTLLLTAALAAPLLAAPVPKALAKRPPSLDGRWECVEWYDDENKMGLGGGILWTIDGERLSVADERGAVPVGFAHDATRTIRRVVGEGANAVEYSIIYSDGSAPDRRPAVIELGDDTLKLCMSLSLNGRPADCKPARSTRTYVFQRVRPN